MNKFTMRIMAMTLLESQHFRRVPVVILLFAIVQPTGLFAVVILFGAIVTLTNLLQD
ncbi:hypothetical protein LC613_41000 [Nostoc sphaeroides CHAB 2801]|uniref:hypothetical protein n=1 Tax=Nostoc sphaeroides TaxID=446679 RepID=UPI001E388383|nr:hypothetical protein [Nostoc sphaeroides]MCC5633799.1 hypothetical protein [Nostoc sphaeroides CHAB 2801]